MTEPCAPNAAHPVRSSDIKSLRPISCDPTTRKPRTFITSILESVGANPSRVQYITADGRSVTVSEFYALSRAVGKSLLHLGLESFQGIGILGFNAVQWFAADVGVTLAGGVAAGIYTTNKPEIVAYILNHSNSIAIFVDDQIALEKALSCWDSCSSLKAVVAWGGVPLQDYEQYGSGLYTWDEFLELGKDIPDASLDERMNAAKPEGVAKLIYTSGTTGPPKAVMLSHDNITFTVDVVAKFTKVSHEDHLVSYLPASHIAANSIDICGALTNGATVTFARPDALKGSLVETLKKVRPTVFLAVPRVFEKIQEKMLTIGARNGFLKRLIATWGKGIGLQASRRRNAGDEIMPWGYELANFLVFSQVRKSLGLDRCRLIFNAAAPLQKATVDYFSSLDFRIHDIYGMSEATGPLTANYPDFKSGTSGKVVPGIEVKLQDADENGEGELCFRGRNMFVGYLKDDEETCKALDDDGYIHSGDIGRIDEDGFVKITGRVKELIVTAGGENVAPALVESSLISAMPAISRAYAVGDKRKFISCLLVPYMDEEGQLIGPACVVNPKVKHVEEAVSDKLWDIYITEGISRANMDAISNAARVRKYTMLTSDFSLDGGELTPTMKVKRKIVDSKYADLMNQMYGS